MDIVKVGKKSDLNRIKWWVLIENKFKNMFQSADYIILRIWDSGQ